MFNPLESFNNQPAGSGQSPNPAIPFPLLKPPSSSGIASHGDSRTSGLIDEILKELSTCSKNNSTLNNQFYSLQNSVHEIKQGVHRLQGQPNGEKTESVENVGGELGELRKGFSNVRKGLDTLAEKFEQQSRNLSKIEKESIAQTKQIRDIRDGSDKQTIKIDEIKEQSDRQTDELNDLTKEMKNCNKEFKEKKEELKNEIGDMISSEVDDKMKNVNKKLENFDKMPWNLFLTKIESVTKFIQNRFIVDAVKKRAMLISIFAALFFLYMGSKNESTSTSNAELDSLD